MTTDLRPSGSPRLDEALASARAGDYLHLTVLVMAAYGAVYRSAPAEMAADLLTACAVPVAARDIDAMERLLTAFYGAADLAAAQQKGQVC